MVLFRSFTITYIFYYNLTITSKVLSNIYPLYRYLTLTITSILLFSN